MEEKEIPKKKSLENHGGASEKILVTFLWWHFFITSEGIHERIPKRITNRIMEAVLEEI